VEIVPLHGVGPIRFGQSSDEVHLVFGHPFRRVGETEQYDSGWMIDYDEADRVEFVQTYLEPRITWEGRPLIGAGLVDVVSALKARAVTMREEGDRLYADELGFGFMGDPIESVWVYPTGYYT
jgi:hypothetical protein